jgi:hypothetical protein
MVKILSVTRQSEVIKALSPSTPVLWSRTPRAPVPLKLYLYVTIILSGLQRLLDGYKTRGDIVNSDLGLHISKYEESIRIPS